MSPTGLIPWFSKTEGNTYATLLHHPFLFKGKTNACSRGSSVGFPIHPFLQGLLEYDGLQLHSLTPTSILHIAGYVALCELFLGCEAHFDLWRRLLCLIPHNQGGSVFEVGGAKVWRIAGTGYLPSTSKKAPKEWPSEWFYIDDVALPDPVRMGLPEFSSAPLRKRHSWHPRSLEEEDSAEISLLLGKTLASPDYQLLR